MRIQRPSDALIIVDLQPDFMPGGPLAVAGGDQLVAPVNEIAKRFSTVVATQDWHPRGHVSFASTHGRPPFAPLSPHEPNEILWPDHCVAGTAGAALHPELQQELVTLILRKGTRTIADSYSAFRENVGADGRRRTTGLAGYLRERDVERVFLCGLARDYCVRATALDAVGAGFATVLLDDLTRAVDPDSRDGVDAVLAAGGVRIALSSALDGELR